MSTVNVVDLHKEKQFINELRDRLLSKDRKLSLRHDSKVRDNDKFLERYLCKYESDLDKAEQSIEKYMRRHEEISQHCLPEQKYPQDILDLCQGYFTGTDHDNRLVIAIPFIGDFRRFFNDSNEDRVQLLFSCLVKSAMVAEKLLDEQKLDSTVAIVDVSRIPYSYYLNRKLIAFLIQMLRTLIRHLPAIATPKIIILNAPWHFTAFLNFVTKLIKFPADIVVYSSTDLKWKDKLRDHVPEKSLLPEFGGSQTKAVHVASLRDSI